MNAHTTKKKRNIVSFSFDLTERRDCVKTFMLNKVRKQMCDNTLFKKRTGGRMSVA